MRVGELQFVGITLLLFGALFLGVGAYTPNGVGFALGVALLILAATAGGARMDGVARAE